MDPEYARSYRDLYERHWWWRARESAVLELLEDLVPGGGFGKILDVGCGDGLLFPQLGSFGEPEGVEPDASIVSDVGRRSGRIHTRPFDDTFKPEHDFGLIVMLDVLEHLQDPVAALAHAKSLLAADGRLLVTVPAFTILWTAHDDYNHHLRRYRRRSLESEVHGAGLETELVKYFFHWMFPVKLGVAFTERFRRSRPQPARVPGRTLNGFLFNLCRVEQRLTQGIRLPFGSSLMAVLK